MAVPVVAGLPHVCRTLAAAGRIHKVIHDDPHDGSRPLKLSVQHNDSTVNLKCLFWLVKTADALQSITDDSDWCGSRHNMQKLVLPLWEHCSIPVRHECQVGAVGTWKSDGANRGADDADADRLKTLEINKI